MSPSPNPDVRDRPAHPYPVQIHSLTSIRYVAAAWVVLFHFQALVNSAALLSLPLVRLGYLGVDFFFILSGFVLAHVYRPKVIRGKFDYWDFLTKRIGRIYPMHVFTLSLFIIFGLVSASLNLNLKLWDPATAFTLLERGQLIRNLTAQFALIHAWGATSGLFFNLPSWSISAEWFAYLLFPVFTLIVAAIRPRGIWPVAILSAIFVGLGAATSILIGNELTAMSWNIGIFRIAPEFMLGIALYAFGETWTAGRWAGAAALSSTALAFLTIMVGGPLFDYHWLVKLVVVLGLGAIILFAADAERQVGPGLLAHPILVLLGEISYSVYMVHMGVGVILFEVIAPDFTPPGPWTAALAVLAGLGVVTALSYLTYRLVEIPGRRMITTAARRLYRGIPATAG